MGCSCSSLSPRRRKGSRRKGKGRQRDEGQEGNEMQPPREAEVSKPTGGPVMVPPPYRDATGRPIEHSSYDLDRKTIFKALENMTSYLQEKGVTVHAVTVGGAVNTLYLKSRKSTHDVDFFLGSPSADEHHAIYEAARYANRQTDGALGGDWFNNATQLFLGQDVQRSLAKAAFEQNIVIFERLSSNGGLKVYAAPWSYAFCGKLNRLCEESYRPYNLADAVVYLHELLQVENASEINNQKSAWNK